MDDSEFEGTLVLEKLAEAGKVDAFFEAVDSDDVERVIKLLRTAGIDSETIQIVLKKVTAGDD